MLVSVTRWTACGWHATQSSRGRSGIPGTPLRSGDSAWSPWTVGPRCRSGCSSAPGRSGLSVAIDRMPDKEQKIVLVRMREVERNITVTLAHIKKMAEGVI
jgi:hypothetical protein